MKLPQICLNMCEYSGVVFLTTRSMFEKRSKFLKKCWNTCMLSKWFCISINTHPFSQETKQNKAVKYSHKLEIQQYCERTFTQFSSVLQRRRAARFYPPPTLTSNRWTAPSCSFLASTWAWETQGASYWVHRYLCYLDLKHILLQTLHSNTKGKSPSRHVLVFTAIKDKGFFSTEGIILVWTQTFWEEKTSTFPPGQNSQFIIIYHYSLISNYYFLFFTLDFLN